MLFAQNKSKIDVKSIDTNNAITGIVIAMCLAL